MQALDITTLIESSLPETILKAWQRTYVGLSKQIEGEEFGDLVETRSRTLEHWLKALKNIFLNEVENNQGIILAAEIAKNWNFF